MSRPRWEVADVIHLFGEKLEQSRPLTRHVRRTLDDMAACRTAALGGHVDGCDACGSLRLSYNSCGNRNCGKCQGLEREAWILGREQDLLPVVYYHVVFTIAAQLNSLCLYNLRTMYGLLFEAAWQTLQVFARDEKHLGAAIGATMVLHTWGQNLGLHPHIHAIVPGGGLAGDGKWQKARSRSDRFLFPVKAMSRVFRAIFLKKVLLHLENGELVLPDEAHFQDEKAYRKWRNALYQKPWVVYAKRPFGGPKQVLEYLGRYTHKTAISNHRLLDVSEKGVRFAYKDYRTEGKNKEMTLDGVEFLRRFTLHILPGGFRRMRHYGILSNTQKKAALAACRSDLAPGRPPPARKDRKQLRAEAVQRLFKGEASDRCPCCKTGRLRRIGLIPRQRAPPAGQLPNWISCTAD